MIRFAICDTNQEFLDRLATKLHQFYDPCTVEYMYGPDALELSLRMASGGVDVLLTEVKLRGKTSIDIISRYLKESSPLRVIYLAEEAEYCTAVYETRHSCFLVKPISTLLLRRAVDRALAELERNRTRGIVVRQGKNICVIDPITLLYAEGHGRMARLVTESEKLECYEKIGNLMLQTDRRFLQCHKSYLVNMDRVRKFCGDHFLMDDGISIPISQSKRKESKARFLLYMGSGRFLPDSESEF